MAASPLQADWLVATHPAGSHASGTPCESGLQPWVRLRPDDLTALSVITPAPGTGGALCRERASSQVGSRVVHCMLPQAPSQLGSQPWLPPSPSPPIPAHLSFQ